MIETVETLRPSLEDEYRSLLRQVADVGTTVSEIVNEVAAGNPARAHEVKALLAQQDVLQRTIADRECKLAAFERERKQAAEKAKQTETQQLFAEMEATRTEVIELARRMALLLGTLHCAYRRRGEGLVPKIIGNLTQQRFASLLAPIDPFTRPWVDWYRDLPLDYLHIVKVRPLVAFRGENASATTAAVKADT